MKLESQIALTPRFLHLVPFLDVVMLLITFFLLGSSMLQQSGIAVALPASSSTLSPTAGALIVTLSAGESPQLYLNDKPLTLKELDKALEEFRSRSRQVVIRADEHASVGQLLKVTNLATSRGYDVACQTIPLPDPAP